MSHPLAFHLTWTAYGTWLSGDERGWVESGRTGIQSSDRQRFEQARSRLAEPSVEFTSEQRELILTTIQDHCRHRGWTLHAVNIRSNHVHVVVSGLCEPETMMNQFKAWCSRRLSDAAGLSAKVARHAGRRRWFTAHGSTKWINDEQYLADAIHYVLHGQ
ncbi:MAG TPA: transposase [Planctomycetaceae bacterium]|nr:transposase [Planctomycetaceae bacterium]